MNIKDKIIFIADKGFFSAENIAMMEQENLSYIIPLHRNNALIDLPFVLKLDMRIESHVLTNR